MCLCCVFFFFFFFLLSSPLVQQLRQTASCVKSCGGNVQTKVSGGLCARYRCWEPARPRRIGVGIRGNEENQRWMWLTAEERDDGSSRQRLLSHPIKPPPVAPPSETTVKSKTNYKAKVEKKNRGQWGSGKKSLFVCLAQPPRWCRCFSASRREDKVSVFRGERDKQRKLALSRHKWLETFTRPARDESVLQPQWFDGSKKKPTQRKNPQLPAPCDDYV